MKRILNLNDFSVPALKGIAVVGLAIPAGLFVAARVFRLDVLAQAARGFLILGGILLLLFLLLVILEHIQDQILFRQSDREKGQRTGAECPYCGNRNLRAFEHQCPVCGKDVHRREES